MMAMSDLANAVDMALRVLSRRFLTLLALTMTFSLASWSMILGTWYSIVVAGGYAE